MNNELYEKLARFQWLSHRQQMRGYHHGGHLSDATRGQGRILATLRMKDGISTKDLSYLLGLAVSSLNEFLSKLEKGGYITREASEQDKRVMLVKLTEKGKAQQEQSEEVPDSGDIFDCLTQEEQAAFGIYLDKVIAALQEKLGFDEGDLSERFNAIFTEMSGANRSGFDPRQDFRGGIGRGRGGFGHRGGFDGRGQDERGSAPKDMPGAERFDPDYDGPIPGGRSGFPFGRGQKSK